LDRDRARLLYIAREDVDVRHVAGEPHRVRPAAVLLSSDETLARLTDC
jgi:hypothetical protein